MDRTLAGVSEERGDSKAKSISVRLSPNAVNPKVPVAALGAVELGQLIGWLAELVGLDMPTNISAILGGILAWVIASYVVPHRVD